MTGFGAARVFGIGFQRTVDFDAITFTQHMIICTHLSPNAKCRSGGDTTR